MGAAAVLVCALNLLGRSGPSMPPTELVAQRPQDVSKNAEAFVRPGSGIISVLTDTDTFRSAECGPPLGTSLLKLASILAHEASHVRSGPSERLAYEAQLRTLLRLGVDPQSRLYSGVAAAMRVSVENQQRREKQEEDGRASGRNRPTNSISQMESSNSIDSPGKARRIADPQSGKGGAHTLDALLQHTSKPQQLREVEHALPASHSGRPAFGAQDRVLAALHQAHKHLAQ